MSFDIKLIDGDFSIKNGDVVKVESQDKLIQDILKICYVDVGSNPLQPWYGSYFSKSLIGSIIDQDIINNLGKMQLIKALENLKSLQEAQLRTGQNMSLNEQLAAIVGISVDQNPNDPTMIIVKIKTLTKSLKTLYTEFELSP